MSSTMLVIAASTINIWTGGSADPICVVLSDPLVLSDPNPFVLSHPPTRMSVLYEFLILWR